MSVDHGTDVRPTGLPQWTLSPHAGIWGMVVWMPLLLAEPVAHATEPGAGWWSWPALAVIAVTFIAGAVLGTRRIQAGSRLRGRLWPPDDHQPSSRSSRSESPRRPERLRELGLPAAQAIATVAVVAGSPESSLLFPLLAIATVVTLEEPWGLISVPSVTLLSVLVVAAVGGTSAQVGATAVATALTGFGCWSYRRLFFVIAELARTRQALARLAVAQERERFSRDLHDLLGHTLSVIVVKAQAVRRLAPLDAAAAAEHAADIESVGRRALVEVRQAVDGYRGPGLAAELDRAETALPAAGIRLDVPSSLPVLPPEVDALFGWVVREGVTNVIRHSGAATCVVNWVRDPDEARLEITDDGPGSLDDGSAREGGLVGLTERVTLGGGRLEAGPVAGGFRLTATVPLPVDA